MRSCSAHIQGQGWNQRAGGVLFLVPESCQNIPSYEVEQAFGLCPAGLQGQMASQPAFVPRMFLAFLGLLSAETFLLSLQQPHTQVPSCPSPRLPEIVGATAE